MNRNLLMIGILACMVASANVAAEELLVTGASNKAGNVSMLSLDLATDGESRGIQARISVPKGVRVDTTNCLSGLPQGFQGVCEFNQGEIRVMAFAFDDRKLPAGLVGLGTIQISGRMPGDAELKVVDFQSVNSTGKPLPSKSTVSVGGSERRSPAHGQQR